MDKPEVIELLRKFVASKDNLYPLLDISAKELIEYIDKQNNIIKEIDKFIDLALEIYNNVDLKTLELIKNKLEELKGNKRND